jgi:hypothetical protein
MAKRARDGPYLLTDRTGRHVWCGPGLRPLAYLASHVQRIPLWDDLEQARAACAALKRGIGIVLVPRVTRVR